MENLFYQMNSLNFFSRALPVLGLLFHSCSQGPNTRPPVVKVSATAAPSAAVQRATTPASLSLSEACALSVQHHPSLSGFPMDQRAADARTLKATRLPNPELGVDAEDFFGSGGTRGTRSAIFNAQITQLFERGGKRQARTNTAQAERVVLEAQYAQRRLEIIQDTSKRYIDAVAAFENVAFLRASLDRARETQRLVDTLVEAGRVTAGSGQQARISVQELELEVSTAERQSHRALQSLSAQWGDTSSTFALDSGLGVPPSVLSSKDTLRGGLEQHPSLALAQAEADLAASNLTLAQAEADLAASNLTLAKANRFGDIGITGGLRQDNSADEVSATAGLSIPIPIFDHKEDTVKEMAALADKAEAQKRASRQVLESEFALAWTDLASAHETARKIESELLPGASELFKTAEESFRAGKITSLEYLAARQQFHSVRGKWLTARHEYQLSAARVQSLTNRCL